MTARPNPRPPAARMRDATEEDLVVAARTGSEAAVRELIRRLNPRLFRIARGILPGDAAAEDAVQDAYLAAFTRLDQFRGEARFSTWITRIAINTAQAQRRRIRPEEGYDTVAEDETTRIVAFPGRGPELPESAFGRAQSRTLLEVAIAELPPDLRLPFLLHEVEELRSSVIARDLGLNIITVRTRIFRARRRLRAILEARLRGSFEAVFPFDGERCAAMADRVVRRLQTQPERPEST